MAVSTPSSTVRSRRRRRRPAWGREPVSGSVPGPGSRPGIGLGRNAVCSMDRLRQVLYPAQPRVTSHERVRLNVGQGVGTGLLLGTGTGMDGTGAAGIRSGRKPWVRLARYSAL